MSGSDLETIRQGVAALNRGDVDALVETLDPEVELVPLRAVLDGSVYRGHDGLRQWLDDMGEDWTRFELRLDDVRELASGSILVEATMLLRGQSGVTFDSNAAWLCQMHAGKVRRLQFFADAEAALAASEPAT